MRNVLAIVQTIAVVATMLLLYRQSANRALRAFAVIGAALMVAGLVLILAGR